jgi:hypothetical protein
MKFLKVYVARSLSLKHHIPIEVANAILKLKKLEEDRLKQGYKIDSEYTERMERYIGASDSTVEFQTYEPTLEESRTEGKPFWILSGDLEKVTYQDASRLLGKKALEYKKISDDVPIECEDPKDLFIRSDVYERNDRWNFFITDINRDVDPKERLVLVRQSDGVLRHANRLERFKERSVVWKVTRDGHKHVHL